MSLAHDNQSSHEEVWQMLPWLANGRLDEDLRTQAEQHLGSCSACSEELAAQRRLHEALRSPERVTYAPGPSFAKLSRRIDAARGVPGRSSTAARRARPRLPGLALAATVLLAGALAASRAYLELAPSYQVHSDTAAAPGEMVHIAFARELTIGEVEQLLRGVDAQVVEGPGSTGIFGIRPAVSADPGQARQRLRQLAASLRGDPRVRWIEPMAADACPCPDGRQAK